MRVRRTLVVVQVALSLGLLATGGQVLGAVKALYAHSGAREPERLVVASFDLAQLKVSRPAGEAFYRDLLSRVSLLPQVESASLARRGALWTWGRGISASSIVAWRVSDGPKDGRLYLGGYAHGDLFGTVGLPVAQGRTFRPEDATPQATVAIVSRAFADNVLNGNAVGKIVKVGVRNRPFAEAREVRVIGVIDAAADLGYSKRPMATIYVASPLDYEPALSLYLRLRSGAEPILADLTTIVRELDPRVPVSEMTTLSALFERRYFEERVMAQALALLGIIALSLATAGLYGVVSFMVAARTRELGIRLALGASPSDVLRLVLSQSGRLAMAGGAIGFFAAVVLGAIVHASLVGAPGLDPLFFLAAASLMAVAMGMASYMPARRAARVDPIAALRRD
jgi:hypothetical protein